MEPIQSISRALMVLEAIAESGALSINELHNRLGLNKPSLSRIAATLYTNGYLNKDPKTGDYMLTLKTFEIGVKAVRNLDYINLIKGTLAELSSQLGLIAQFSIEDRNEILCLESFDHKNSGFSIYTRVGQRSPLYCTSAGKAILSTYSNEEILKKWDHMNVKQLTENTIIDAQHLLQDIAKTRQRNYALDLEENEHGVFCIGTVLLNYNRRPIGAISLSGNNLTETDQEHYGKVLLQHTQRLSNMLGYA